MTECFKINKEEHNIHETEINKLVNEINTYERQHIENNENIYDSDSDIESTDHDTDLIKEKKALATNIRTQYQKMNDKDLSEIVIKCLSKKDMKHIILKHELKYYKPDEVKTFAEFIFNAKEILDRYQHRAGGFLIEDQQWILHTPDSKKYTLKENEIIFENTISIADVDDEETHKYLKRIVRMLKQLNKNIKVNFSFIKDEPDNIYIIFIKCVSKFATLNDNVEIKL